jgi:hypothetical protein
MATAPSKQKAMEDTEEDVSTSSDSGVKVPEEFQKKVAELLKGASKQEIDFVQDCCYDAMSELERKDRKSEFSTEHMPTSY